MISMSIDGVADALPVRINLRDRIKHAVLQMCYATTLDQLNEDRQRLQSSFTYVKHRIVLSRRKSLILNSFEFMSLESICFPRGGAPMYMLNRVIVTLMINMTRYIYELDAKCGITFGT